MTGIKLKAYFRKAFAKSKKNLHWNKSSLIFAATTEGRLFGKPRLQRHFEPFYQNRFALAACYSTQMDFLNQFYFLIIFKVFSCYEHFCSKAGFQHDQRRFASRI
ncbi:MAG: hypothetical protein K9J37_14030 [Saprospiraceae bacterium]|nr:hypothetical protein [Saprospiraceae bacterium]MCF8251025.1 hypothetical protein [Saprospiraceae bacterium]MCF8281481.1 hypothetical protein [Bacteroidales bacterium]MCF8311622.1 hypothetical protein [Saprospiraceae bacterium]MCF8440963.1 hypothetical protein [Saprospiraceae bacterium]